MAKLCYGNWNEERNNGQSAYLYIDIVQCTVQVDIICTWAYI